MSILKKAGFIFRYSTELLWATWPDISALIDCFQMQLPNDCNVWI